MAYGGYIDSGDTEVELDFRPSLIFFMAVNQSGEGWSLAGSEQAWLSVGFATWSGLDKTGIFNACRIVRYIQSADWQSGSGVFDNCCCLLRNSGGGADEAKVSVTSFLSSGGFTVSWDADTGGKRIYYLAVPDDDVVEVYGQAAAQANIDFVGLSGVATGGMTFDSAASSLNIDNVDYSAWPDSLLGTYCGFAYPEDYPAFPTTRGWSLYQVARPFSNVHATEVEGYIATGDIISRTASPYFAGYYIESIQYFFPAIDGGTFNTHGDPHVQASWMGRHNEKILSFSMNASHSGAVDDIVDIPIQNGEGAYVPIEPRGAVIAGGINDASPGSFGQAMGFWGSDNDFHAVCAIGKNMGAGDRTRYGGRDYSWMSDFSATIPGDGVNAGRVVPNGDPAVLSLLKLAGAGIDQRLAVFLLGPIEAKLRWVPQIYRLVRR